MNLCKSFPCMNSGKCTMDFNNKNFICACPITHSGDKCQNPTDCYNLKCKNRGRCLLIGNISLKKDKEKKKIEF